ncbi:MAG TPA: alpha/beta hydrolase [Candidatus Dormibacteraeota bacterium]|nr:alpha/beta hydrolase [Candidatus Dormibacteraeota bacterium]
MPRATANGISIEYETFGDPAAPPVLLVMGLGAQMISWNDEFCELLAGRGFHVIRFDNRDCGLSTWMDEAGPADIPGAISGEVAPAYMLDDMAADAVGLLDALGIRAAHVVGASMGGFIAQLVAINHPERVLTLTSIMSGPAHPESAAPAPEATAVLFVPPAATREERITQEMWIRRLLMGPADSFDEKAERARAERAIDRAYHPAGTGRQLAAVLATQPRLELLKGVQVPTLVIHGLSDILIPVENGRAVAAAVPGSRLVEIEGMGHDLPKRVWPQLLDEIVALSERAGTLQRS